MMCFQLPPSRFARLFSHVLPQLARISRFLTVIAVFDLDSFDLSTDALPVEDQTTDQALALPIVHDSKDDI
jgi:hypothetical protein